MENLKTIAVNAVIAAIIGIVLIWGNTLYRQHVQFNKGEKGVVAGDFPGAVAGYESAIHMYTPGSSLVDESAEKLWAIGQTFEQRSDIPRALIAYRSLRSSFYAIRGLYSPGTEWIQRCDAKIAMLVKMQQAQQAG